jgi:hypothetical protein
MLVLPKLFKGVKEGFSLRDALTSVLENTTQEGITGFNQRFLEVFGLETTKGTLAEDAAIKALNEGIEAIPENAWVGGASAGGAVVVRGGFDLAISAKDALTAEKQDVRRDKPIAKPTEPPIKPTEPAVEPATERDLDKWARISDKALDDAYGYGLSEPGSFGFEANKQSAAKALEQIEAGETDIDTIADAVHEGWAETARTFDDPVYETKPEKKQARMELADTAYEDLAETEKEKDRVVARAILEEFQKTEPPITPVAGKRITHPLYGLAGERTTVGKLFANPETKQIFEDGEATPYVMSEDGTPRYRTHEESQKEGWVESKFNRTGKLKAAPTKPAPEGEGVTSQAGLAKEAAKHKTADEFVAAQDIVYHSGSFVEEEGDVFVVEDDGGIHFGTEDAALARIGGKAVDDAIIGTEVYQNDDGTWGIEIEGADYGGEYLTQDEAEIAAEELAASTEVDGMAFDERNITAAKLLIKNPKKVTDQGQDWTEAIKQAKKEGYDSIVYVNQFEDKGSISYIAFSPEQIVTKSQLEGIWEKAKLTPTKPQPTAKKPPAKKPAAKPTPAKKPAKQNSNSLPKRQNSSLPIFTLATSPPV